MIKKISLLSYALIINASVTQAGVQLSDFYGSYNMIIDGSKGTLQLISYQNEKDYNLKGTYIDIEGKDTYQVKGCTGHLNPDIPDHKLTFFINFKETSQMFEGYLMIKTKDAIVGYTMVNELPVGFYATKEVESQPVKKKHERKAIFSKPIKDKISDLRHILNDIRTTILVYNGQHHHKAKLGSIWDENTKKQISYTRGEDVANQLLQRTDRYGLTKATGANKEKLEYGPYFHDEFPINPITQGNTIHLVDSPLPIEKCVLPEDYDWIYNLQTCEFRAGGQIVLPPDIPERREDNSLLDF
ncbi:MAG: hypothetical protein AB1567_11505 [bacterium]